MKLENPTYLNDIFFNGGIKPQKINDAHERYLEERQEARMEARQEEAEHREDCEPEERRTEL